MNPLTARDKLRAHMAHRQPERRQRHVMLQPDVIVLVVMVCISSWLAAWAIYDTLYVGGW